MGNGRLTRCQIGDIHCGNARFIPELLDRTLIEINRANPMAVVVSGDLTDAGYGKSSSKPQST
jgi:Icc protein